jgi:hypothetical protein
MMWPPYEITIWDLRLGTALILGAVLLVTAASLALAAWGSWKLTEAAGKVFAAGRRAADSLVRRCTRVR